MTGLPENPAEQAIREHERELLEELQRLLHEAVPPGATVHQAEFAMVAAVMGGDPQITELFDRVGALAHNGRGLLHEFLNDPNIPRSRIFLELDLAEMNDDPVVLDVEDAFGCLLDTTGELARVSILNPQGEEITSAAGLLINVEGIEEPGERFGELTVSSADDPPTKIRLSRNSKTRCVISSDGTVRGELPDGSSWSVAFFPDAQGDI